MGNRMVGSLTKRLLTVLFVMTLLLPMLATSAGAANRGHARVHPYLSEMSGQGGNGAVRVIVQGNNPNGELAAAIIRAGGQTRKALPLVKAFSADLPANAIGALADDPNVQWITVDAPMFPTVSTANLATDYPLAVRAPEVWNAATSITGAGVTVAVIDSGIDSSSDDFGHRVVQSVRFDAGVGTVKGEPDGYGHGTHVAGIIASSGDGSNGKYIGIAPQANLINLKVADNNGVTYMSDVIDALQWVVLNRAAYGIRVVNLSLVSSVPESYRTSPLDAAVELAWLSGIAVVVSAGNGGADSVLYPPVNDPLVITVGAVDTSGTAGIADDLVPDWSSYGVTQDSVGKPDVVAPGRRIISNLASRGSALARQYPERIVDKRYFSLSGTSMAAPVVSGIGALAFQAHDAWTPDQLKSALMVTARPLQSPADGAGEVDAAAVVSLAEPGYANQGIPLNDSVAKVAGTATYDSVTWNSVTWNSVTWNSVTWNSVTWNSVTWNSVTWNSVTWNAVTWNSLQAGTFPD